MNKPVDTSRQFRLTSDSAENIYSDFPMERTILSEEVEKKIVEINGDNIALDLIEHICYERRYNLFGYGIIDPVKFAKDCKLSLNRINEDHKDPYQLKIGEILSRNSISKRKNRKYQQDAILYKSVLQNAIYFWGNFPANVTITQVQKNNVLLKKVKPTRIFCEYGMIQDLRTGKIRYYYKLNEDYERNLANMYVNLNFKALIDLRKSNLKRLYLFLIDLRNALMKKRRCYTTADDTPQFRHLCKLAHINLSAPKYNKKKLNESFQKIRLKSGLEFSVEWVKGEGQSERYTPLFHFETEGNLFEADEVRTRSIEERINVAVNEFIIQLAKICPFEGNKFDPESEDFFYEWIRTNDEEQLRNIDFALRQTFVNVCGYIPENVSQRRERFSILARSSNRGNMHIWLRGIFHDGLYFHLPYLRCERESHEYDEQ